MVDPNMVVLKIIKKKKMLVLKVRTYREHKVLKRKTCMERGKGFEVL